MSTSEQATAALTAEADAVLPDAPADQAAPTEGTVVDAAPDRFAAAKAEMERAQLESQQYLMGSYVAINACANVIAPNWKVDENEKRELAEAFALAAALWFPGLFIPPKYAALFGIGAVVWGIGAKRYNPETKQLLPLRVDMNPDAPQAT